MTVLVFLTAASRVWAQVVSEEATIRGTVVDAAGKAIDGAHITLTQGDTRLETVADKGRFEITNVPYGQYDLAVEVPGNNGVTRQSISIAADVRLTIVLKQQGLHTIGSVSARSTAAMTVQIARLTPGDLTDQGETTWRHVLEQIPGVDIGTGSGNQPENNMNSRAGSPLAAQIVQIGGAAPNESSASIDGMPIQLQSINSASGYDGFGTDLSVLDPFAFSSYTVANGPAPNVTSILNSIGGTLDLTPPGYVRHDSFAFSNGNDAYGGIISNIGFAKRLGPLSVTLDYGTYNSPGPSQSAVNTYFGNLDSIATINGQSFSCGSGQYQSSCVNYPDLSFYPPQGGPASKGYTSNFGLASSPLVACCASSESGWTTHDGSLSLFYQPSTNVYAQVFYTGLQSRQIDTQPQYLDQFAPASFYTGSYAPRTAVIPFTSTPGGGVESDAQFSSTLLERLGVRIGPGILKVGALQVRSGYTQDQTTPQSVALRLYGTGYYYDPASQAYDTPVSFDGQTYDVTQTPGYSDSSGVTFNRDQSASYVLPLFNRFRLGASFLTTYNTILEDNQAAYELFDPGTAPTTRTYSNITLPNSYARTTELRLFLAGQLSTRAAADVSYFSTGEFYHGQIENYALATTTRAYAESYTDEHFTFATPRLGFSYALSNASTLRASAGGSFSPPAFDNYIGAINQVMPNEQSNPTAYVENTQNLKLRPETAFAYSLGIDSRIAATTHLSVYGYLTDLHDKFFTALTQAGEYNGLPLLITEPSNIANSREDGLSLSVAHDPVRGVYDAARIGFTRGYVFSLPGNFYNTNYCTHCSNLNTVSGINLPGVAYSQAYGQLGYRWAPNTSLDAGLTYYGSNNSYYRPAFAVLSLNGGLAVNKNFSLHATLRNLTNRYSSPITTYYPNGTIIGQVAAYGPALYVPGADYGPRTFTLSGEYHLGK